MIFIINFLENINLRECNFFLVVVKYKFKSEFFKRGKIVWYLMFLKCMLKFNKYGFKMFFSFMIIILVSKIFLKGVLLV